MNANQLLQAGQLQEAVAAANAAVKASPADVKLRSFLCELLCFQGDFDRADKLLDALAQLDTSTAVGVSLFRQLVRGAKWRQQTFQEGRLPEFIDKPPEHVQQRLQALVHLRAGEEEAAARLIEQAEDARPQVVGECDGNPFDDLRDLDDVLAPVLELLTSNGKYYWIPFDRIESLAIEPPRHARDLLWRRAQIFTRGGPSGEVHLPVLYPGTEAAEADALKLGRSTDWNEGEHGSARGVGQRMLLVGDEARPFLDLQELTIRSTESAA